MHDSVRPYALMRNPRPEEVSWTTGFWGDRWATLRDRMIPSQRAALHDPTNAAYLGNFAAAANRAENRVFRGVEWSDGDCYKYLEALTLVSARDHDADLEAEIDSAIEMIGAAQESDGYISTYVQLDPSIGRFVDTHNHELYNMGHLHTAAATHYSLTGRHEFLNIAVKNADYLETVFGPRPVELAHFGWNPSNIMGLVDLARVTGEKRYVQLAETFVDMRGSQAGGSDQNQDHVSFRRETRAVGHAVTGPYLYAGALDVAMESGDLELVEAAERIWRSATCRRMYITGGIGSHHYSSTPRRDRVWEAFGLDYDLPNGTAYNETCANLALAMWGHRHTMLSADPAFADVVERVMYNAGLSGVSIDGESFCYTNPLRWYGPDHELLSNDAPARWHTFTCYCCPVQVTRTLARLHEWFYGIGDDEIWIHQYGGSQLQTRLANGREIRVEQATDFPWSGDVRLTLAGDAGGDFTLNLRIPEWATGCAVTVNGEPTAHATGAGTYLPLRRAWLDGDVVDVALPMPVTPLEAAPQLEATRNQIALSRGPLVYCLESIDLPEDVDLWASSVRLGRDWSVDRRADLLGGIHVLRGELDVVANDDEDEQDERLYRPAAYGPSRRVETQLVPYYAWGNRGPTQMTVWVSVSPATASSETD